MTGSDHSQDSVLHSPRYAGSSAKERLNAYGKIKLHSAHTDDEGEGGGGGGGATSPSSEAVAHMRILGRRATIATPRAALECKEQFR